MSTNRYHLGHAGLLLIVLAILGMIASCGATARDGRKTTVQGTLVAARALSAGFETFSSTYQDKLVDDAKTKEEATAAVTAFRAQRDAVLELRNTLYDAIVAAFEADFDEPSVHKVIALAKALREKIEAVRKGGS